MKKLVIVLTVFVFMGFGLAFSPGVWADPITGVELNDSFNAKSTNALNYANGSLPYVYFISNGVGSVTLEFLNNSGWPAYFEQRIDGAVLTSGEAHYNPGELPHDFVYPYFQLLGSAGVTQKTYTASDMVEIRFAFGAESNWRFDWTAFKAVPASVPEPATMLLLGLGLVGLAGIRRKFRS